MLLKEIIELEGKVIECNEGRTSALPVNKILLSQDFKRTCNLYVIFYNKTIKVQAIFIILPNSEIEELCEVEELYCNITK